MANLITPTNVDSLYDAWTKMVINAPFSAYSKSSLGGVVNTSFIYKGSLDPENKWINNIYQNSRFMIFTLNADGSLELINKHYKLPKFRKSKVKAIKDAQIKINAYIASIE